jgi:hypothetical protein
VVEKYKIVPVRMDEKEYAQLLSLAQADEETNTKEGKAVLGKYIRKCIFDNVRKSTDIRQELSDTKMQIRKANVNLNRIMMHLESNHIYENHFLEELLKELHSLQQSFSKMISILLEGEEDGNY